MQTTNELIGRCDNCPATGVRLHPIRVPYGSDREERETLHVCDGCDLFGGEAACRSTAS